MYAPAATSSSGERRGVRFKEEHARGADVSSFAAWTRRDTRGIAGIFPWDCFGRRFSGEEVRPIGWRVPSRVERAGI